MMDTADKLPIPSGRHRGAPTCSEMTMNFKRKGPKSTRAGCLLCKPHKRQGVSTRDKNMQHGNRKRYEILRYQE